MTHHAEDPVAAQPADRDTAQVRIVQLDLETLRALEAGDLARARGTSPVPLSEWLVAPECRRTWRRRVHQVAQDPEEARWVTGVVVDEPLGVAVGQAGFHGVPDDIGMVEVGYSIDPAYRRRGYGRATLAFLVDRACAEPSVRTVRASVSPDNAASLALVAEQGFVRVGEQWDEEDGLELVLERPATREPGLR